MPAIQSSTNDLHQQSRNDNIHGLTVPDLRIRPTVSRKDSPETPNTLLALEARVLGQTSIQVLLNLINGE